MSSARRGLLTALVPGSMILMTIATMLARAVRRTGEHGSIGLARLLVPLIAGVALFFTFRGGDTLVTLLLMGYSMVTQLFPALMFALWKGHGVRATAAIVGIVVGETTVAIMTLSQSTLPCSRTARDHRYQRGCCSNGAERVRHAGGTRDVARQNGRSAHGAAVAVAVVR